ncbi:MAG: FtsX-like permease family protein [Methylovulum sp.]|uniref:ABC transporter permease n=1 Tax=Methylovulum sp. TaxID=1916980 RepID=UPI00262E1717|nr:FtsX-like permease family protein [Methylovulum sp.]MDD2723123.1 FtsX-like permease family protein [Methylovulum sp.]MDD5124824.1 FtsX-like permease family protein [Methylovulum sp.]
MNRIALALRMLWRDSRSGELTILLLALIIAVTSSTAIALFSDRLQRTMANQTAEFLAADLVVTSSGTMPESWTEKSKQLHLTRAQTVEFSSVLIEHDEMLLASIKAVTGNYPLRGQLKTTAADYAQETATPQGPPAGEVWVEKRVLPALKLQLGDRLTVGESPLKISRIITYEPDKQGDFYSFSPRVMMNDADLTATHSIQPGSHVHYFFQFIGATADLQAFKAWVKPQLNPSQRLLDIHEDRPELGSALDRAERYLGLSSTLVIIISGVAIAMATRRYTERHFDNTALLRCLGCKQQEILWLYASQFVVLGVGASGVGCLLGWVAQHGLFALLKDLLPKQLAAPGWPALAFGFAIGLAVLLGFALPPLLRLKKVSPLRVLRRDLEPMPASAWLVYGLALGLIAWLIWQYTDDLPMTATLLGVGAAAVLILGLLVFALLGGLKRLRVTGLHWRFGLQNLARNRQAGVSQILAFSLTLVAMILSFTVRNDLLDNWQQQLPDNAPNHFALNIFPQQQAEFAEELTRQHISGSQFYPVVRGRLVAINNIPVQKRVSKDSQGDAATHRELSLTWTDTLPDENNITAGAWRPETKGLVSVEQKLADSLKIKVGDVLAFTVGSGQFTATVSSLRSLRWDTMKPNFYMIFSKGTLDKFPSTYLTSFYLPRADKNKLNALVKKYPNTTVMEVDAVLQQIKTIITQLTQAINYLLYFALLAGFTVLFAAVYATLDQRIYEGALMRTLGANRKLLRNNQVVEFAGLGFIAGVVAVLMSEAVLYALYTRVMGMGYQPNYRVWLVIPLLGAVCVGLAGCRGLRGVLDKAPLTVLRKG